MLVGNGKSLFCKQSSKLKFRTKSKSHLNFDLAAAVLLLFCCCFAAEAVLHREELVRISALDLGVLLFKKSVFFFTNICIIVGGYLLPRFIYVYFCMNA